MSAPQITTDIKSLQTTVASNVASLANMTSHVENTGIHITADERAKWNNSGTINVKNFEAWGNALFYDNTTRTWWTDSTMTTIPHDDGIAIQTAIDYAVANNISIVHFPNGGYYCNNRKFEIDTSKIKLVGANLSNLISDGLTTGAFISVIASANQTTFDIETEPIRDIKVYGDYSTNNPLTTVGIIGIENKINNYFTHASFANITIIGFNFGLKINNGSYKNSFHNIVVIACDTGVYCSSDYSSTIPTHFYNLSCNCCAIGLAIVGSGGTEVFIMSGTFEYNRINYAGAGIINFNSVRFEFDMLACCNNDLTLRNPFIGNTGDQSLIILNNCTFFITSSYLGNVAYWIKNPVYNTILPTLIVVNFATNSIYSDSIVINNLTLTTAQIPTSKYIAGVPSGYNVKSNGINFYSATPIFISSSNNMLSVDISPSDPYYVNVATTTMGGDYGYTLSATSTLTIPYNQNNSKMILNLNMETQVTCSIYYMRDALSLKLKDLTCVVGDNNIQIPLNLIYNKVQIRFNGASKVSRTAICNII